MNLRYFSCLQKWGLRYELKMFVLPTWSSSPEYLMLSQEFKCSFFTCCYISQLLKGPWNSHFKGTFH